MPLTVEIKTIPHREQRYDTLGDYWQEDGVDHVRVSATGDRRYDFLIALHEMVEMFLCQELNIAEAQIARFDIAHPELDDPGASADAPYHNQHVFAEGVERLVATQLGVKWADYEARCKEISGG